MTSPLQSLSRRLITRATIAGGTLSGVIAIFAFFTGIPDLPTLWRTILPPVPAPIVDPRPPEPPRREGPITRGPGGNGKKPSGGAAGVAPSQGNTSNPGTSKQPIDIAAPPSQRVTLVEPTRNWLSTFEQALNDRKERSQWHCDTSCSQYIEGGKIEVVFAEPRLQDAAEIVHRLRSAGANVLFRLASSEDASAKQSELFYHWNFQQMAGAIQTVVYDIEVIDLQSGNPSPRMVLRIF